MGGYENLAVRDAAGNIVGYRSTTGGSDFVPSANYIALQQQYRIQQGATVGSGPTTYAPVSAPINYNDNSAAGIAAMITARGGVVDPYLSQNALQQGFITPQANIGSPADARSTVPIWDLSYEATKGTLVPGATHATYPVGNEGGVTLIPGRTWLNTVTGESITENIPYGHSIYNIAGGGGAYSAQSGTTWAGSDLNKIPSAVVRTQDYGRYAPSDTRGVNTQLSVPDYATILANPKSYSRGGSEAYNFQAGVPLQAGRVLQTQETAAPTYGSKDWYSQRIAWGDRVAAANTEGNPQKYPEVFAGSFATPTTQRLVEGVVTSEPGSGRRAPAGSGMLVNYITPAGMQYKKGDDTSLAAQNVDMIDYGYKYTSPLSTPDRRSAAGGYVATPEPKEIWGRTTTLVPPTQESGNRFGDLQTTMGYVPNPKYVAPVEAIATKAAMPTVYGEAARQVVTANYKDIDTSLLRKPIENISTIPVETIPQKEVSPLSGYFGKGIAALTSSYGGVSKIVGAIHITNNEENISQKETPTVPIGDYVGGVISYGKGLYERSPLKMAAGVVGSVGYGYAGAADVFGAGTGTSIGYEAMLASNPVGWGVGVGLLTTFGLEYSGRLGLTGQTKETSVRTLGGGYMEAWNRRLAEENLQGRSSLSLMSIGGGFSGSEVSRPAEYSELPAYTQISEIPAQKRSETELPAYVPGYSEIPAYLPDTYPVESRNPNENKNPFSYGYPIVNPNPNENKNPFAPGYPNPNPTLPENPFLPNPTIPVESNIGEPTEPIIGNPYLIPTGTQLGNPYSNPTGYEYPNPTVQGPPSTKIEPPKLPIIPILPSFPGVPSTPTGTPAKRRRAFTEFLPIGEGVGWINLLGTPTRQPAIMPSRKAAPAPAMRIAVPKSTSTVRIPKQRNPAKQKPIGGFSINIPKAKKGRVRRIS